MASKGNLRGAMVRIAIRLFVAATMRGCANRHSICPFLPWRWCAWMERQAGAPKEPVACSSFSPTNHDSKASLISSISLTFPSKWERGKSGKGGRVGRVGDASRPGICPFIFLVVSPPLWPSATVASAHNQRDGPEGSVINAIRLKIAG